MTRFYSINQGTQLLSRKCYWYFTANVFCWWGCLKSSFMQLLMCLSSVGNVLAGPKTWGLFCFQSSFVVTPKALLGGRPCRVTSAALNACTVQLHGYSKNDFSFWCAWWRIWYKPLKHKGEAFFKSESTKCGSWSQLQSVSGDQCTPVKTPAVTAQCWGGWDSCYSFMELTRNKIYI